MKTFLLFSTAVLFLSQITVAQQDISGTWQGTVQAGPQELRIVLKIAKAENGGWTGTGYSIDQGSQPIPITSITLEGSTLKIAADSVQATYEGTISADGASIQGTLTQGGAFPLELRRPTKETEWKIAP